MQEITLTELSQQTGLTVSHLNKLISRGQLPEGEKRGRTRYLPREEAIGILTRRAPYKPKPLLPAKTLTWEDLI